jgi:sugar phosphate isomerase/epimerase
MSYNYRISIASYSFNAMLAEKRADVFAYLEKLKYRYHVDNADIWTGFLPTLDDDFIKKVKLSLDTKGIKLANLCVDGPHLWVDDAEKRDANKKKMYEYIKAAEILGAQSIRIDFGGTDGHTMSDEAFEYIVNTYTEYCNAVSGFGAKIGPENHWGWDRVPAYLKKVKEAVNHPAYGHLFHLDNFYDDIELGREVAISYAMHTHLPADKILYSKPLLKRLADSGYQGTYSVEHHTGKFEEERVEWQLGVLKTIIAELKSGDTESPAFVTTVYNK